MTDINETTFTDSINVSAASEFGQEVWTFIITDKKDNVASKSIIITTNDGATENLTGSFYHIAGALKGSYDLVDNAQVSATPTQPDALKDMKNTDLAGATFTGSWETKNDTRFVKSLVAYSDLTMSAAALEFNQASVTLSIVPSPSVGDVYIAKLRGEENYTVISITENNPTADCGATCTNKGRLSFSYKK